MYLNYLVAVAHHEVYTRLEFLIFIGVTCGIIFYVFKPKISERDLNNLHYVGLDNVVRWMLSHQDITYFPVHWCIIRKRKQLFENQNYERRKMNMSQSWPVSQSFFVESLRLGALYDWYRKQLSFFLHLFIYIIQDGVQEGYLRWNIT